MHKYRRQIFIGLLLALGIYILMLLVLDGQGQLSSTEGIGDQLARFDWRIITLTLLCQTGVILFRFVEWQYFLGVIGARDKISLLDSAVIFVSGFTMVVSPGKAAEVLKSVFLKTKTGVPIAKSAPVVIAERVVDGLAVIVIMVVTLLIASDRLQLGAYESISRTIVFSSASLLAAGLIVIQIQPLAYFVLNRIIARLPLIKRLHEPLIEFYESSREIFKLRHVIPMTVVGTGVYLASALGFLTILAGFGLEVTPQLFVQVAFIVGVSSAVGALSFVPNGAGVTEISNLGMLLVVIAPTNPIVTPAVAAAAALLQGFFHKWFRVLVGLAVAFIFRRRLFSEDVERTLAEMEADSQTQPERNHHPAAASS